MDHDEAVGLALALLREQGPQTDTAIFDHLLANELNEDEADDVIEALTEHGVWWLAGEVYALPSHILVGNVFTHRLTAEEIGRDAIDLRWDLAAEQVCDGDEWVLPDGQVVSRVFDDDDDRMLDTLVGPPGWLKAIEPERVVGLRWSAETVAVEPVDPVVDDDVIGLVREVFDRYVGPLGVLDAGSLVRHLAFHPARPFAVPRLPFDELAAAAGLDHHGDLLAARGFDFDAYHAARHDEMVQELAAEYDLTLDQAEAFDRLLSVANRLGTSRAAVDDDDHLRAALSDPAVTAAYLEECVEDTRIAALVERARAVGARAVVLDDAPAGGCLVAARLAELDGDLPRFVELVERALIADANFTPALWDAAFLAEVRGDAATAIDLRRRAGAHREDEPTALMRRFASPPPGVSRNAPCPCGSGRKTKFCCLASGTLRHPLDLRVHWLFDKLESAVDRPPFREAVRELAHEFVGPDAGNLVAALAIAQRPFWSFVLFDAGLVNAVLDRYGSLLPDDEAAVAERWRDVRHRLLQLDDILPATGIRVTDALTGERFQVTARIEPGSWRVGEEVVGWLLPVTGSDTQMPGEPVAVPAQEDWREPLLASFAELERDRVAVARTCMGSLVGAQILLWEEERRERIRFLFPDVDPDEVDPDDEDLLAALVEEEHSADESDDDLGSFEAHVALHVVTARRVIADVPSGTWDRVKTLRRRGHDRHEILHDLAYEVSREVWAAMRDR